MRRAGGSNKSRWPAMLVVGGAILAEWSNSGVGKSGDKAVVDEAAGAPLGETLDLMTALQFVLRKSLAHGGLVRGHHEGAKVIEKHTAQLCVLVDDCNQPDHIKLVTALRADHNVSLKSVPSAKTLGE
ncbi:40S ribosomal protein S12-like [Vitis riparia]|uniref:40S ribosomal protein S12-like n=1 Tax=Vitis riparia TaxID=96939 RepID=UPI00155A9130|nr:40S ribosomal protein S12-like [Vitis riparia]